MPLDITPRPQTPAWIGIGGGHGLFVRDWGEGPPVVLLSSWAMDSTLWGQTMAMLNDHGLRTIAYDRRGHGRSTDPGGMDYDTLADDLQAVLSQLDLKGVTLVAHSGAGGEAIRYVSRHGAARLRRLVLVGATGPCMRRRPASMRAISHAPSPDGVAPAAVARSHTLSKFSNGTNSSYPSTPMSGDRAIMTAGSFGAARWLSAASAPSASGLAPVIDATMRRASTPKTPMSRTACESSR